MNDKHAQLQSYVHEQQAAGHPNEAIRNQLVQHGWSAADIDVALTGTSSRYSDRANRTSFLLAGVYIALLFMVALGFAALSDAGDGSSLIAKLSGIAVFLIGAVLIILILIVPFLAGRRRLHDVGQPWYWLLGVLLPFGVVFLWGWLQFAPGQNTNKYGVPNKDYRPLTVFGFRKPRLG